MLLRAAAFPDLPQQTNYSPSGLTTSARLTQTGEKEKEGIFLVIPILPGASSLPVLVGFVAQGSFHPAKTALNGKRKKLVLRNARS